MARNKTMEILTLRNGSWSIEGTAPDRQSAEKAALQFIARPGVMGVRVIRESARDVERLKPRDILFEKLRPAANGARITIGEVDSPIPVCESPEALFSGPGRRTLNRLFRAYLDKQGLTPTEIMHNARELKRLSDFEMLLPSAVARIAQIQARDSEDTDMNARRDALFTFAADLGARARQVENRPLPSLVRDGVNAAIATINSLAASSTAGREAPGYLFRVAASRDLVAIRNWWAKFATAVDWAHDCNSAPALANLDWFISDTLANTTVLQELLGPQDSLASALLALVDIADGAQIVDPERAANPETVEATAARLNSLLHADKLPETRKAIIDRVQRQLRGSGKLTRDPGEEPEAFRDMLQKLVPGTDPVGGPDMAPDMAEAITHRQSHIINKGGESGLKEAAASLLPALHEPGRKAGYLLSLLDSELGRNLLGEEIERHLDALFLTPDSVNRIVKGNIAPNRKMEQITSIFHRIRTSGLPEERKQDLTGHLDDLLAAYIIDGRILDRVNDPDKPLHIRAFMLVSMCQPEMLPDGKASKLAREIIVKHLRRPDFERELVAPISDPEQKEKMLRDFHVQLNRSGFFG